MLFRERLWLVNPLPEYRSHHSIPSVGPNVQLNHSQTLYLTHSTPIQKLSSTHKIIPLKPTLLQPFLYNNLALPMHIHLRRIEKKKESHDPMLL
jgi:hypothetical protein